MTTSIELQDEEKEVLVRVLTRYISDLRFEISNTERLEMRQDLHKDEELLKGLLERFGPTEVSV
jgi:hypothetical protein